MAFAGVVTGGVIALLGGWLKDVRDSRAAVQRWMEDEFVFAGVEPVYQTLEKLATILVHEQQKFLLSLGGSPTIPFDALSKLRLILGSGALTNFMTDISASAAHPKLAANRAAMAELIRSQQEQLAALQEQLLRVAVRKKRDVYSIRSAPEIKKIAASIETIHNSLNALP